MKKNIKKMSYNELVAERDKLRKELLNLRVEQVMSHLDNPLALRTVKRDIARLNTLIHAHKILALPRHLSREAGNGS